MSFPGKWSAVRVLALIFCSLPAIAQVDRATLTGAVTDATGASVGDAIITVQSPDTGYRRETRTSGAGLYQIPGLLVNTYTVTVEKTGFSPVRFEDVVLAVGQTRTLNAELKVGGVATQVDVTADATPLDQSNAEIGLVIADRQIRDIPLNGRHWASLMQLAPGAVNTGEGNQNSIRFFGRPRDDNNWTFDGVDAGGVKDPRQEGNLRLVMSTDSLAEFRVNALPFTAESGVGSGAQINLVSKTGSNSFHGTAYEYLRNSALDARRPFDGPEPPPFRLNQFGANLGGPVLKNRTFFFANYEGLLQRLSVTRAEGTVPSAAFRARTPAALRPLIDAYPQGSAPTSNPDIDLLIGATPERRDEHTGLLRIDHRINDQHNLFFRFNTTDGFVSLIRNALLETRDSVIRPTNITAQWQQVWSSSLINEVKIGMNRSALDRFDVGRIAQGITLTGFTTTQPTTSILEKPTSYAVIDNLSWILGRHTLKTGVEIRRIHLNVGNGPSTTVRFASRDAFLLNAVDRVQVSGELPTVGGRRTFYIGYVQDEFKVSPGLTLNLGVRYEYYTVMKEVNGRGRVFDLNECRGFCAPGTAWYSPDRDNIAPRVSLAWTPAFPGGKTVIRTGYGRYYGPGQNDDITAALDSIPETLQLTSADAPGLNYPVDNFLSQLRSQGRTPRSVQRDRKEPEAHQWTLSVQRQFGSSFAGQLAYVGSVGRNQFTRTYVNVLDPVTRLRPLSTFNQIDEKRYDGVSSFNGLQASLLRSFTRGWLFQTQYMWSKSLSDNSGSGEGGQIMITSCRACDKGPADSDIRHTATVNSVYELPFGRGRRVGNSVGGFGGALLSGWDLSGLYTVRTGRPFSVFVDRSANAVPTGQTQSQRPSLRTGSDPIPADQIPSQWLLASGFVAPANGDFGNTGRNAFRGPGLWQIDLALTKRTALTEQVSLDFRAEVFNFFNRAQYGDPANNLSNPATFGRILSTANDGATGTGTSRQLQFMLRLNF